jgi:hypothetical protein
VRIKWRRRTCCTTNLIAPRSLFMHVITAHKGGDKSENRTWRGRIRCHWFKKVRGVLQNSGCIKAKPFGSNQNHRRCR